MISNHRLHDWWYRCLVRAEVVPDGTTSGERMHKARHTAGQLLLDATGNLKAVQGLLMHESIMTTADTYVNWDLDRLAQSLAEAIVEDR
jgi:site-specific recombinase XerC